MINKFILIIHKGYEELTLEGFFPSAEDTRKYAEENFPQENISIYELSSAKDFAK